MACAQQQACGAHLSSAPGLLGTRHANPFQRTLSPVRARRMRTVIRALVALRIVARSWREAMLSDHHSSQTIIRAARAGGVGVAEEPDADDGCDSVALKFRAERDERARASSELHAAAVRYMRQHNTATHGISPHLSDTGLNDSTRNRTKPTQLRRGDARPPKYTTPNYLNQLN